VITEKIPNRLIAWRSEPSSLIQHAGAIRFDSENGYTRVQVRLSYTPPAGAVGHLVATVLGSNPKQEMDEDLVRMQTFIETGKRPHDAARQIRRGIKTGAKRILEKSGSTCRERKSGGC
jgi:uncharacterized membrane protein